MHGTSAPLANTNASVLGSLTVVIEQRPHLSHSRMADSWTHAATLALRGDIDASELLFRALQAVLVDNPDDADSAARVAFCIAGHLRKSVPTTADAALSEVHSMLLCDKPSPRSAQGITAAYLALYGVRRVTELFVNLLRSASTPTLAVLIPAVAVLCCDHGCDHGPHLPAWVRPVAPQGSLSWEDWSPMRSFIRSLYASHPGPLMCLAAHWPLLDAPWRLLTPELVGTPAAPRAAHRMWMAHPDLVRADRRLFHRALEDLVFSAKPQPPSALRWLVFFYAAFGHINAEWRELLFQAAPEPDAFVATMHAVHMAPADPRTLAAMADIRALPKNHWAYAVVPAVWFPVHSHEPDGVPHFFACQAGQGRNCVTLTIAESGSLAVYPSVCTDRVCALAHAWADAQLAVRAPRVRSALADIWAGRIDSVNICVPCEWEYLWFEGPGTQDHPLPALMALCLRFIQTTATCH